METKRVASVPKSIHSAEEAAELCLESLKINPDSEELWIAYGELLERVADLEGAEAAFRSALSINPVNARSLNNLGILLRKRGLLKDARDAFERAIELDIHFPNPRFNLRDLEIAEKSEGRRIGAADDKSRRPESALKTPNRSDAASVWLSTADDFVKYGNLEQARELLEKGVKYHSGECAVWLRYASVLEQLREFELLEQILRKAVTIHPSSVEAWNWLGTRALIAGKVNDAIESLKTGFELAPSNSHSRLLALLLVKTAKPNQAIEVLMRCLEGDRLVASNWNLLGVLQHQCGHHDEAMKSYKIGLEIDPESSNIHNNIGRLLEETGDEKGAVEAFDRAVSIDKFNSVAWNNLGLLLRKQGYLQEAEKTFRISVSIAPQYANAWLNLRDLLQANGVPVPVSGKTISEVGKWAQSGWSVFDEQYLSKRIVDLTKQVEHSPYDAEQMYELSTLMFKIGRYQDSQDLALRAMERTGETAGLWNLLGMICERLGDPTTAELHYRRAIDCDHQYSIALLNLYDLRGTEQNE